MKLLRQMLGNKNLAIVKELKATMGNVRAALKDEFKA